MASQRQPRSVSHGDQLSDLRAQASALITDRAAPALSDAAASAAVPLRQALSYLPAVVEYGGLMLQAFRWAKRRGQPDARVPQHRPPRRGLGARLRRYIVPVSVLGIGYALYRVARREA